MLEQERDFFEASLSDWLGKYAGRVVLVRGNQLIGVFDDEDSALSEGTRQFGLTPFLIRRVHPAPAEVSIPALTLGILRADTPCEVRWAR